MWRAMLKVNGSTKENIILKKWLPLQGMVLYMTIILVIKSQKYVTGYLLRRSRNPSCISRHTFAGPNLTVIDWDLWSSWNARSTTIAKAYCDELKRHGSCYMSAIATSFGNDGFNVAATLPRQHWHTPDHYGADPFVFHTIEEAHATRPMFFIYFFLIRQMRLG